MSTVFYMVEQFDSMGVQDRFQYVGIFVWEFSLEIFALFFVLLYFRFFCVGLLVAGGFIWFPLHMTMVWDLVIGSGNPSNPRAMPLMFAYANINQHDQRGWGFPLPTGPQAQGYRPPSRGVKAVVSCFSKKNDELRAKSEAICSWWEERMKRAMGGPRGYVAWNHTKLLMH